MSQFFNPKMINSYITTFSECAKLLVENLKENYMDNDHQLDLIPHLEKCAVRGVCSSLFGMNLNDKKIDVIYIKTAEIFEA